MNGEDLFNNAQLLAPPRTVRVAFDDGSFVLRSPEPLQPYARCVGEWLEHWAQATPDAPAFADAGEITDKGYINQGAVLRRRADVVARLYAGGPGVTVA